MSILEGEELDAIQQPSPVEVPAEVSEPEADAHASELGPTDVDDAHGSDGAAGAEAGDGHDKEASPLAPQGDRFKQVWARAKAAEARATQVEAEARQEREERIRLEERLRVREEKTVQEQPQYTWAQLQAGIDAGQIDMAKALEIRDAQLLAGFRKEQQTREEQVRLSTHTSTEMGSYKQLVPNITVPGTDERKKVETEYAYLTQRLGRPTTKEQEVSMELAAVRAAFGDVETLKSKARLSAKPLTREPYMDTSGGTRKPQDVKKEYKHTLSSREVQHYERLMKAGRYPGGWADVKKENEEYVAYKAGAR